jgi:hypothetical protein
MKLDEEDEEKTSPKVDVQKIKESRKIYEKDDNVETYEDTVDFMENFLD